jgi:hypothetical protein
VASLLLSFPLIFYTHSSFPHSRYMLYPFHLPLLDHSNYTWRRVQVMKLLVMQFSPPSRHLIPLQAKYPPQHPQSMFCLNVRGQVSHPYRTRGKIIVLYILICTLLGSRQDNTFYNEIYIKIKKILKLQT